MKISKSVSVDNHNGNLIVYEPITGQYDRVYFIYGAKKDVVRGHHAHRKLEQLMLCVYGSIEVTIFDGQKETIHILDDPTKTLKVGAMVWRTMKWLKDDSVLFVLATEQYDEMDYIRDYDEFLQMVNK
jgi:dTDP-4-dehydrorhamnose 3,5-epimerase-like enzyme